MLPPALVPAPIRSLPLALVLVPTRSLPPALVPAPIRSLPLALVLVPTRSLPPALVPVPTPSLPPALVPVPTPSLPPALVLVPTPSSDKSAFLKQVLPVRTGIPTAVSTSYISTVCESKQLIDQCVASVGR
jgi:hypothetical protein